MKKEIITKTAFQQAYAAWFADYEHARRLTGVRRGDPVPDIPAPPASPDAVAQAIDRIGRAKVLSILGIHRTTLDRWQTGAAVIPRPAWLLLVLWSDGRLPGMSEDWRDFHFEGDRLTITGTRAAYTAREIAGWHYQIAHADALARRVVDLEQQIAHLLRIGHFDAANAPVYAV
jgi:hypothetical protein